MGVGFRIPAAGQVAEVPADMQYAVALERGVS